MLSHSRRSEAHANLYATFAALAVTGVPHLITMSAGEQAGLHAAGSVIAAAGAALGSGLCRGVCLAMAAWHLAPIG
jgi:hypothetical protein